MKNTLLICSIILATSFSVSISAKELIKSCSTILTMPEEINKVEWLHQRDIPRDDEALIKVVKTLKKKANGRCADLQIVKIPDDVEYEISEYDGLEHIAEKHRTWG